MASDTDTVSVPKEPLISHIIAQAQEVGEWDFLVSPPERDVDGEVDFSLEDVADWDVDQVDDGVVLSGVTEGTYQVQTARAVTNAPPSRCHPAEHETRSMEVFITIEADFTGSGGLGEFAVRAEG